MNYGSFQRSEKIRYQIKNFQITHDHQIFVSKPSTPSWSAARALSNELSAAAETSRQTTDRSAFGEDRTASQRQYGFRCNFSPTEPILLNFSAIVVNACAVITAKFQDDCASMNYGSFQRSDKIRSRDAPLIRSARFFPQLFSYWTDSAHLLSNCCERVRRYYCEVSGRLREYELRIFSEIR